MAEQKFAGILTKLKRGIGRPVKGEEPWQCDVHRGEIVVEIPINERSTTDRTPHNYRLYIEPNVTLYAQPSDVTPLYGAELDYLLAIDAASVRFKQYLQSDDFKKSKMKLKVGDIVLFKLKINEDAPESYVHGKIRYLGKLREHDGVYFGIEILVSYWIITLCNLYMYLYRRNNIVVEVLLMVDHILAVVLIMLYMLLWIRY